MTVVEELSYLIIQGKSVCVGVVKKERMKGKFLSLWNCIMKSNMKKNCSSSPFYAELFYNGKMSLKITELCLNEFFITHNHVLAVNYKKSVINTMIIVCIYRVG